MTAISKNLRTLKEQRDTTQSAIAAVAGASNGAVSKCFSGEKVPRAKYLDAIASYYLVSLNDLTSERHGLYAKAHGLSDAPVGATAVGASSSQSVPVRLLGTTFAGEPDDPIEHDGEAMICRELAEKHPNCLQIRFAGVLQTSRSDVIPIRGSNLSWIPRTFRCAPECTRNEPSASRCGTSRNAAAAPPRSPRARGRGKYSSIISIGAD